MNSVLEINHVFKGLNGVLQNHSLYKMLDNHKHLHLFMQSYAYAVWDSSLEMSELQKKMKKNEEASIENKQHQINKFLLNLKSKQQKITLSNYSEQISLINLYIGAMQESGANTSTIRLLIKNFQETKQINKTLKLVKIPQGANKFCLNTMKAFEKSTPYLFGHYLYGRMLPMQQIHMNLGQRMGDEIDLQLLKVFLTKNNTIEQIQSDRKSSDQIAKFILQTEGQDKQEEILQGALDGLYQNIKFFDSIYFQINRQHDF